MPSAMSGSRIRWVAIVNSWRSASATVRSAPRAASRRWASWATATAVGDLVRMASAACPAASACSPPAAARSSRAARTSAAVSRP